MNTTKAGGPDDLGWTEVEACTLPTVERPLRLAEFDTLFRTHLHAVEPAGDTRARLLLSGDPGLAARVQRLADEESSCCSFFTFGVFHIGEGLVVLDIEVPAAYVDVLAGLVARAEGARGVAS